MSSPFAEACGKIYIGVPAGATQKPLQPQRPSRSHDRPNRRPPAEQDGKPLKRTAGSLSAQAKGLKTTEYPLRYRLISSDPVRVTLFDGDGGEVLDYVFEVE